MKFNENIRHQTSYNDLFYKGKTLKFGLNEVFNTEYFPIDVYLMKEFLDLRNKTVLFHCFKESNLNKLTKYQNKYTNPISCFSKISRTLIYSSECIAVIEGIPLIQFERDIFSIPSIGGKRRFIPIRKMFFNNDKLNMIFTNKYRKFLKEKRTYKDIIKFWKSIIIEYKNDIKKVFFSYLNRKTSSFTFWDEILVINYKIKEIIYNKDITSKGTLNTEQICEYLKKYKK